MSSANLPLWVQYAQALGPTIAAVIAACLVAYFSYRQWHVAQGKLKSDLFERRYALFERVREDFTNIQKRLQGSVIEVDGGYKTRFLNDKVNEVSLLFGRNLGEELLKLERESFGWFERLYRNGHIVWIGTDENAKEAQGWWWKAAAAYEAKLMPAMDLSVW